MLKTNYSSSQQCGVLVKEYLIMCIRQQIILYFCRESNETKNFVVLRISQFMGQTKLEKPSQASSTPNLFFFKNFQF